MSSFSLSSSELSVVKLDWAGDFAGLLLLEELLQEEPLPEAGVSSERLPPLMTILPSLSFVAVSFPECLT